MSQIQEVLRLKYRNKLSNREIQTMTGISRSSVSNYLKSFSELEATLEEVLELNDVELAQLFHICLTNVALELVASIALDNNISKVDSIESMLRTKIYETYDQTLDTNDTYMNSHENIRGSEYYKEIDHKTVNATIQ
jgi:predicted transcriptional regulator